MASIFGEFRLQIAFGRLLECLRRQEPLVRMGELGNIIPGVNPVDTLLYFSLRDSEAGFIISQVIIKGQVFSAIAVRQEYSVAVPMQGLYPLAESAYIEFVLSPRPNI